MRRTMAPLILCILPAILAAILAVAWPAWALMWWIAAAVFFTCKALSLAGIDTAGVPLSRLCAYCFAWPGLNAEAFLHGKAVKRPPPREWLDASINTLLGLTLLGSAVGGAAESWPPARGWVGMVGIILLLHFGLLHLLSCFWRARGRAAAPLMNRPLAASAVADFWGRRWNTAFRDFTHRVLFRPLAARWGPTAALLASFFVSGLIHDLVISVPAGAGYGLPTLYFLLQALALLAERSGAGRRLGLGRGWTGRAFALAVVAGPAFLLFHPWFVHNVILPFVQAIGSC